jgi:hypothetical protein
MRQRNLAGDALRAAHAAADLADLRGAMRSAEDTLAGLARAIKAPNMTPRPKTIKRSTRTSFYLSAAQTASETYNAMTLAERIL